MTKVLAIGATLSMIGAFIVCVLNQNILGSIVVASSNIFLFWYAYDAIYQFCRYLMEVAEVKDPEK